MRLIVSIAMLAMNAGSIRAEDPLRVYIGVYGRGPGQGIQQLELDPATGKITHNGLAAEADNPSFLAIAPDGNHLYAVSETEDGRNRTGIVIAFSVDKSIGNLKRLNEQATRGAGPCHVAVDPKGNSIVVANYGGGSVASFLMSRKPEVEKESLGSLVAFHQHPKAGSKFNIRRQDGPHPHCAAVDPNGKYVVVPDLGRDRLYVYSLSSYANLSPNKPAYIDSAPGAGPRHFAFHSNGKLGFAMNELNSTITSYRYDAERGVLNVIESQSTLPADFKGENTTAEVRVHPNGKFVYGSNRGHDSIAAFAVDPESGKLTPKGHTSTQGKTPRNFGIDPSGRFLLAANQNSNSVVAFRINSEDGTLTPTESSVTISAPVCVVFAPR